MRIEENGVLQVEEYNELRRLAGWQTIRTERARMDLGNTWYRVVVRDGQGVLAGMARVLNNGGYFFILVDVIVRPQYRRQGIGKCMLQKVIERMEKEQKEGDPVLLALISAYGREGFYRQFGFRELPDEQSGAGMIRWF